MTIKVIDRNGSAVEGASVELLGYVTLGELGEADEAYVASKQRFYRAQLTNQDGIAAVTGWSGRAAVIAKKNGLISPPYQGEAQGEISLVLSAHYTLRGQVHVDGRLPPLDSARVNVGSVADDNYSWQGWIEVESDGSFGPSTYSVVQDEAAVFVLSGGGLITVPLERPQPQPGEDLFIEFGAMLGGSLPVTVVDAESVPLRGTYVQAYWHGGASEWGVTNGDGQAVVRGVQDGVLWLNAEADGFAVANRGPYTYSSLDPEEVRLVLDRTGVVEGLVLNEGRPVSTFELVYWQNNPLEMSAKDFTSDDGSFVLDAAPVGRLHLYASSAEHPRCLTQVVEVGTEEAATVVLELPGALVGIGSVVDGKTGEPIPGATVQPYTNYGSKLLTPWGDPQEVGSDGTFEFTAFPPGDARLIADAPGYESVVASSYGVEGESVDFGVVPLFSAREARVQLVSPVQRDFSGFRIASMGGVRRVGPSEFSAEGLAVLEGCIGGNYRLRLSRPDGSTDQFRHDFHEGEDWLLELPVESGSSLAVRLVTPSGDAAPSSYDAYAHQRGIRGEYVLRAMEVRGQELVFNDLVGSSVVIEINDLDGEVIGLGRYDLDPAQPQEVELLLEVQERCFRVVDRTGQSLAGVRAGLQCMDEGCFWEGGTVTDTEGLFCQTFPGCESLGVILRDAYLGEHFDRIEPSSDPDAVETIEMRADAKLRVRLVDGNEPVTGVAVWLEREGWEPTSITYPNSKGVVEWQALSPGPYRVRAGMAGYWPADAVVEAARTSGKPENVQLRRRGDLVLELLDGRGEAVEGASVELVCDESDADVAGWVAAGAVVAPRGLTTDAAGQLEVQGLPNGSYRWTVIVPEGPPRSGEVVVPRGSRAEERVVLP